MFDIWNSQAMSRGEAEAAVPFHHCQHGYLSPSKYIFNKGQFSIFRHFGFTLLVIAKSKCYSNYPQKEDITEPYSICSILTEECQS